MTIQLSIRHLESDKDDPRSYSISLPLYMVLSHGNRLYCSVAYVAPIWCIHTFLLHPLAVVNVNSSSFLAKGKTPFASSNIPSELSTPCIPFVTRSASHPTKWRISISPKYLKSQRQENGTRSTKLSNTSTRFLQKDCTRERL